MADRKKIRINIHLDESLRELEHIFYETCDKKSLAGMFLKNLLLFLLEKKGREATEKIIHEVARGNTGILEEVLHLPEHKSASPQNREEETSFVEESSADFTVDVTKFLL